MSNFDVLLFDGYFFDLIVTGLPEVPRLGTDLFGKEIGCSAGGTFNTVRALHRLGLRVGWVCNFGNDLFSQFVLNEAHQEGVDPQLFRMHDHPVRAFSLAFSFQADRGFISYIDPAEAYDR
ncbi:MAG TPA: carbohydrate kinase family protein, partial [Anaerolineaceae bacterium]